MKHARPITKMQGPAPAQFQALIQFLGLFQTLVSLYTSIVTTFFPGKHAETE